jgi:hypothetical protein
MSLGVAVFFFALAPFEIKKTRDAWSWPARKARITGSKIVYVRGEGGGHSLQITVQEVDDPMQRGPARVRFGGVGHSVSFFSNLVFSTLRADLARYPVGKELIAYRDPGTNRYLLEQNDVSLMASVWICTVVWLLANAYWLWRLNRCPS